MTTAPQMNCLVHGAAKVFLGWIKRDANSMRSAGGVLYISYDGMLEPLGQSQVLAYIKFLALGRTIHLVSFEKHSDWCNATLREQLASEIARAGIVWHPVQYHKWPSALATAWDVFAGIAIGAWLIFRFRLSIVHARSYVASVMALAIKRITGARYLFDMRGFWADERVDGNIWPRNGFLYWVSKRFERRFLLGADHVVALTHAAHDEIRRFPYLQGSNPPITVIPTCVDLSRFTSRPRGAREDFVLGYVGSANSWYLFDTVALCFAELLKARPSAKLLILNRGEHQLIRESLARALVPAGSFELMAAQHKSVPIEMARMDAGIFFYKPSFSRVACAPTKLGEFLGCGLPCLVNVGIGDMTQILEAERVGVAVKSFDEFALKKGVQDLLALVGDPATQERCEAAASKHFSLVDGVSRYAEVYRQMGLNT